MTPKKWKYQGILFFREFFAFLVIYLVRLKRENKPEEKYYDVWTKIKKT